MQVKNEKHQRYGKSSLYTLQLYGGVLFVCTRGFVVIPLPADKLMSFRFFTFTGLLGYRSKWRIAYERYTKETTIEVLVVFFQTVRSG